VTAYQGVPLVVVVQKREHLYATQPIVASSKTLTFNQKIAFDATLFAESEGGDDNSDTASIAAKAANSNGFLEKDIKIALRSNFDTGETIGKAHLDIAKYARVPSGMVNVEFKLSNNATLYTRITSRLTSTAKPGLASKLGVGNSSRSSLGSSVWSKGSKKDKDGDAGSGAADDDDWLNDPDLDEELAGLGNHDSTEFNEFGSSQEPNDTSKQKSMSATQPSSNMKTDSRTAAATMAAATTARPTTTAGIGARNKSQEPSKADSSLSALGAVVRQGTFETTVSKLENELRTLKQQLVKLEKQNDDVIEEIEHYSDEADKFEKQTRDARMEAARAELEPEDGATIAELESRLQTLLDENKDLEHSNQQFRAELKGGDKLSAAEQEENRRVMKIQQELDDMRSQLERDESFLRVADELKVAKLALAMAVMELEDAKQQLREKERRQRAR